MKKLLFLLLFIHSHIIVAQSISSLVISKNGNKIAYIKNDDSLFVKNIGNLQSSEKLVAVGVAANGNQKFLKWTDNAQYLVYELNTNLELYDFDSDKSQTILTKSKDSLRFFKSWRVVQTALTEEYVYFSAVRSTNDFLNLFKLHLKTFTLKQLSSEARDVGNMAVTPQKPYLAFATYLYTDETPTSQILLLDTQKDSIISRSSSYEKTMFGRLTWSVDARFLLSRVVNQSPKLFSLDSISNQLKEVVIDLPKNTVLLDFINQNTILLKENDNFLSYDLFTKQSNPLFTKPFATYRSICQNSDSLEVFFTSETGKQPLTLYKKKVFEPSKPLEEVEKFIKHNPLEKYNFEIFNYSSNNTKLNSYIYYPENFNPARKYSLLILPYGGYLNEYPKFGYFLYAELFKLLDKNYIIAFPNTRGFNPETLGKDYGKTQLEDTELFIKQLKQKHQFEPNKIFLMGHSHGATMVYYYLTHSKIFASGIAVNGAADWIKQAEKKSMTGLPDEMGGEPAQHKELYLQFSPIENIQYLQSPILIVAGKQDTQIPYDFNAVAFHTQAQASNKNTQLLLFKDEGHLIDKVKNRKRFWKKINKFLEKHN